MESLLWSLPSWENSPPRGVPSIPLLFFGSTLYLDGLEKGKAEVL